MEKILSPITTDIIDEDGKSHIVTRQDCTDILEDNKVWRNDINQTGDFRKKAEIPFWVIEDWGNKNGVFVWGLPAKEFQEVCKRIYNDIDYYFLRTDK